MARHEPPSAFSQDLAALLARLRPALTEICRRHCLTPAETDAVVYENALFLARRWERLEGEDRGAWLLAIVEEHCRRLTERRAAETQES
jgi:hypothetical protein